MKLPVHPLGPLALVLGAAVVATVRPAPAVVYPANACVSTKQKGAGGFCEGVLRAWAGFEGDGACLRLQNLGHAKPTSSRVRVVVSTMAATSTSI